MPKVKFALKKNEFISPKNDVQNYHFVIKIDLHNVVVRREKDDELLKIPIHNVNVNWSKVDPATVEILYGEIKKDISNINTSDDITNNSKSK